MSGPFVEVQIVFDRFASFAEAADQAVQMAVNDMAEKVANDAGESVSRDYPPASLPGEPSARRSGELERGISYVPDAAPLEAWVISASDHGAWQELGTAHMAARPAIMPAVAREVGDQSVQTRLAARLGELGWAEGAP